MKLNKTKLHNIQKTMRKHTVLGMTTLALLSGGVATSVVTIIPAATGLMTNIVKAADVQAPDFLPAPQRLVIDPNTTSGVKVISSSNGTVGAIHQGANGSGATAAANELWGAGIIDGLNDSNGAFMFRANGQNATLSIQYPHAATIDGQAVNINITFKNFVRNANEYDGSQGLVVATDATNLASLYNTNVEMQISFTDDAGNIVSLSNSNKGSVYLTFGSLDAMTSNGPVVRHEFADTNDANHAYLNKTSPNTYNPLTGSNDISGHTGAFYSMGASVGSDDRDDVQDWGWKRGVTFDTNTDTPTYYVGTTGTAGLTGQDGVDGDPGADAHFLASYNHLMLSSSTSIPVAPRVDVPAPTKQVLNGGKDINGGTTTPNQEWDFRVNQNLPKQPYEAYSYDNFKIEDDVPDSAVIQKSGVKVVDENGNDVSSNFDVSYNGNDITANAHTDFISNYANQGHTYTLVIPTLVNIADQTKTAADLKTDNVATSTVNDKPQTSNHVVVSPKFNTPAVKKSVSVDAGKSWVTDANLTGHDSDYTYKVDYTLSDHVEYATLQLRDYVEDLQSVGGVKIVDAAGNDITGDFTITGLPAAGSNTDGKKAQATITATAKDPSKYTRVGGQISMILSGVTLKGDGAQDDMNYYDSSDKLIHIPNIADMYWKDTTPSSDEPDTLKSNTTRVTPPNPVNPENPKDPKTPVVTKQVSVDGGKTWTDPTTETPAQLSTHDQTYTWMTNFNITNYFNFDGAGSLTLTDHFENLQKYDNVKIMQGADSNGQGGVDITDKFDISEKDTSATGKDIIAAVKAANADDFDDIGGTKDASLANVKMIVNGTTVKGATGTQELNYLTKDGNVDIPNISTLTEDDKVATDYYARSKDSNKAWVRLPRVNPMIDKYVEDDGDSALVNAQDSDVLNNEAAASSSSSSAKSDSSASSSSTATNTTDSSSSSTSSSSSSSSNDDDTLTINDAIDGANTVLTRLDNMAVPYPDSVENSSDNLVAVAADRTSTANDIKKAADALNDAIDAAIKDGSLKTASN
ncbi:MAG: hypothetical protein LBT37_05905 [Lactobacillaceae bacterium]|nr:hypothetical protein [Lactobacillaceae bacterium]